MDCEIVKFRSQYSVLAYLFSGMHVGDPDIWHQTIPRSSEQCRNWQDRGRRETTAATELSAAGVVQPDVCMLVLRLIDSPVGQRSQNATVVRNLLLLLSSGAVVAQWLDDVLECEINSNERPIFCDHIFTYLTVIYSFPGAGLFLVVAGCNKLSHCASISVSGQDVHWIMQ